KNAIFIVLDFTELYYILFTYKYILNWTIRFFFVFFLLITNLILLYICFFLSSRFGTPGSKQNHQVNRIWQVGPWVSFSFFFFFIYFFYSFLFIIIYIFFFFFCFLFHIICFFYFFFFFF